ncbi:MAG: hypothetical protein GC154_11430 [bacterium]|nr:hypothetical protein [bacterium]
MNKRTFFPVFFAALTVALIASPLARAAAYIKFDGVEGESVDVAHKGWSEIDSAGQTLARLRELADGSLSGVVTSSNLTVSKRLDKASPKLAEACLRGSVSPRVTIDFQARLANPYLMERLTLANVSITGVTSNAGADGVFETISLSFEKVHWSYTPLEADGSTQPPVNFGWDLIANAPFDPDAGQAGPTPTPTLPGMPPTPTPGDVKPTPIPGGPTPTPPVVQPTPTPPGVEPTPPAGGPALAVEGDLFELADGGFHQRAVLIRSVELDSSTVEFQTLLGDQFYAMISLPGGGALTNVLKGDLRPRVEDDPGADEMLIARLDDEGELVPFARLLTPKISLGGETLGETSARLLTMSFNGKDRLDLIVALRGVSPQSLETHYAAVYVQITGAFDAASVSAFRLY